jgi:phosphonate transport system substrate-binding protein
MFPSSAAERRRAFCLGVLALLMMSPAVLLAGPPPGSPERPLTMMFVPSGDSQVILKGGKELSRALFEETGLHFKTSVATSYAAVIEAMGGGKTDIGWLPPFSYVLAKKKHGVELLFVVERFGSPFYKGQIVVRADSGIHTLADLKGKTFAYVDPASTSGHLYPKSLIAAQGFNPDRFFSRAVFAGSHNAVLLSVLKGEVDAGATYDDVRATVVKSYPDIFQRVRVLAYTRDIPNNTVTVRKGLSAAITRQVKDGLKALTRSAEGSRILKKVYGVEGLVDLDGLFDPVRETSRLLGLEMDSAP